MTPGHPAAATAGEVVGRDAELSRLMRLLDEAAPDGVATVLEGAAGMGRSTLTTVVAEAAARSGHRLLRCAGRPADASLPFAGLRRLLGPVLAHAGSLPPGQFLALAAALRPAGADEADLLLVGLAARALLQKLTGRTRLLVVVEDGQWLDRPSLDVVCFLARRLSGLPVALLITARTDGQPAPLRNLPVERVRLGPLPDAAARELVERAGCPAGHDLTNRVVHEAQGNPQAAVVLAAAARDDSGIPAVAPPAVPTARLPDEAFLARTALLPASSRRLLLLAAAGFGMSLTELTDAGRRLGSRVADWEPLERSGLVTVSGDRVAFGHPLVRSAVYGAATPAERTRAHRALAAATANPGTAAAHRSATAADRTESEAADLEMAAARARASGAQAEAAAAYSRAAWLSTEPGQRVRRLALAAGTARAAGMTDQATALLAAALPMATDPRSIAELSTARLMLSLTTGTPGARTADFEQWDARLAGPDGTGGADERIRLLWCAAVNCRARDLPRDEWRRIEARLDAIESASELKTVALALLAAPRRAAKLRDRLPRLISRLADDPTALLTLALAAESVQDLSTARACWELSTELFAQSGSPADECQALRGRAAMRLSAGEPAGGLTDAQRSRRLATAAGARVTADLAAATVARAQVWLGDAAAARDTLAGTDVRFSSGVVAVAAADRHWAAGLLALTEARFAAARDELRQLRAHPVRVLWAIADLTEAAVRAGTPAVARAVLEEVAGDAVLLDSPHLTMLIERSRALLADDATAEAHHRRSIAAGRRARAPLELARSRLAYGRWLRRQKRFDEARDELTEALHAFDGAGARPWAAETAEQLRAAGTVATRPGVRSAPDPGRQLTAQEWQVAGLAAGGLTNKQIAAQLHVSPRTVGATLYRAFPKLGITRRAQLHDVLRRSGDG